MVEGMAGIDYSEFVSRKLQLIPPTGLSVVPALHEGLFPHQRDLTAWALRRGRAAIFADTGLGKSRMEIEWARCVSGHTGKPVLILAPLAVAAQTSDEGKLIGSVVTVCRDGIDVTDGINITNYDRLHRFDPAVFGGVVLDESSCIKHSDSKTLRTLLDAFIATPFRLAATATPAPNDWTELGTHAEFLGVCTKQEMLAEYFIHDGGSTQDWRLKGHARAAFWKWVASWAALVRRPSDLGYSDESYELPPMNVYQHTLPADQESVKASGLLFATEARTLSERRTARRGSVSARVTACADRANADTEQWIVWCELNAESEALAKAIQGSVEVRGSDSVEEKEQALADFAAGRVRVLVTKGSIAGWGLNWQHCARMAFVGVTDSWEMYYQCIRRCWRFGQKRPVDVHVYASELEGAVVANLRRKDADATVMAESLSTETRDAVRAEVSGLVRSTNEYKPRVTMQLPEWLGECPVEVPVIEQVTSGGSPPRFTMYHGDTVEVSRGLPSRSADFSVFSPPFASLYTYSNSPRDLGNVRTHEEFFAHYAYLIAEQARVMKPGRLVAIHCMLVPTSKANHGYIGLIDFRGEIIRAYQRAGFIFHSEIVIWKDPVTAMQRTKALGLLWKQLKKDSAMSRQGVPDYVVVMRTPGENEAPIAHTPEEFPVDLWQRYASPVWMDIDPSDTLQHQSAREHDDERHICPLQLEVIRRCVRLWSNPGDVVWSPFAGIGSEGHVALQEKRRFVGAELKRSYFDQAVKNLHAAATEKQPSLFAEGMARGESH